MRFQASEAIRNLVYGLAILEIILSSLAIGGCTSTSSGIPNIFIAKYAGSSLRFGYIGIYNDIAGNGTICASALGSSTAYLANALSTSEDLIRETISVQNSASLVLPAISRLAFALGILSLIPLRRFGWEGLVKTTQILFWGSATCSFAAAWSVTYIVAALDVATAEFRQVIIVKGPTVVVLQWSTFAFAIFIACLVHIITSNPTSSAKMTSKSSAPPSKPPPKGPPPSKPPPSEGPPPKGPPPSEPPPPKGHLPLKF